MKEVGEEEEEEELPIQIGNKEEKVVIFRDFYIDTADQFLNINLVFIGRILTPP